MKDNLKHYLTAWNLSDAQPLAETVTSDVYTVTSDDERMVLKLLTAYGHEEKAGAVALAHWNGHGAVRLLRRDDQAQLMEYADGQDLIPFLNRGEDERATEIIADVITQLHSRTAAPPDGLYLLKRWFRSLFEKADVDRQRGLNSAFVRAAPLAEALLDDPRDVRVLHGDIHHANVRYKEGRGWLAFDPKGLLGERTYDTANTLCNLIWFGSQVENEARLLKSAEILADRLSIDLNRLLMFTFVYACLSASWSLERIQDDSDNLEIAELVEPHLKFT
ncbi:MAG: phosphotransferase [Chloroflexi bacterium]|nr:phosphotransferase [Chloroflexota bacterium]